MNFFDYKNGQDFLNKTGLTPKQAIEFLDKEIEKLRRSQDGLQSE